MDGLFLFLQLLVFLKTAVYALSGFGVLMLVFIILNELIYRCALYKYYRDEDSHNLITETWTPTPVRITIDVY